MAWATSGQPLVWDGRPIGIDSIIPYTYDLRHVWVMPGQRVGRMGHRPYAGAAIEEMVDLFMAMSDRPSEEVARALTALAEQRGYPRERNYLHSAIGISQDGETVISVLRHGAFEDVAGSLIHAGAYRAIELDQGGSCGVLLGGTKELDSGRTTLASHYFRPRGTALLVFELDRSPEEAIREDGGLLAAENPHQ